MYGITIGLQSLSQLKKKYKDSWESVLDCCDSTLYLGNTSKETNEYISALLRKKDLVQKIIWKDLFKTRFIFSYLGCSRERTCNC